MTDIPNQSHSTFVSQLSEKERAEAVREAYKKHATELLAIEDAQQKLVMLVLAIFGAGATFLGSIKEGGTLSCGGKAGITIVVISILLLAGIYTWHRNRARGTVRGLIVRCEQALGFYDANLYRTNDSLYPVEYQNFPKVGGWLGWTYWFTVCSGFGLLVLLWSI